MSVAVTTDGVEVELSRECGEMLNTFAVRIRGNPGASMHEPWRTSEHECIVTAAEWVESLTWNEVRLGCL
jgi:hypothetical protein